MRVVQAELAGLFATLGRMPRQVQTDRGPCFIGAEGARTAALPGRLTLWLAGLGISQRLIPARRPQHNGAVERFHGGVEHSWRGEAGGLTALQAVWNLTRPPLSAGHLPYRGRAGFGMERVWEVLADARVERQVNRQGKVSLWDRPVWVGVRTAGQPVIVTFDPVSRRAIIRDAHERVLREAPLDWLTEDWLWDPVPRSHQHAQQHDTPTVI